jgi:hypothetical protein
VVLGTPLEALLAVDDPTARLDGARAASRVRAASRP